MMYKRNLRFPPGNFLPQTVFVEELLREVVALLPLVPDSRQKRRVMVSLEPFYRTIVPSVLGIKEVEDQLVRELGYADPLIVADILLDAAYDLNLNYASSVVRYHVDEYIAERT